MPAKNIPNEELVVILNFSYVKTIIFLSFNLMKLSIFVIFITLL